MSARYETPLLGDVKVEELKIWGENIKFVSFVKRKPKMHDNKISASLPLGLKSNSLTQRKISRIDAFINARHKDFRVEKLAKFRILTNRS